MRPLKKKKKKTLRGYIKSISCLPAIYHLKSKVWLYRARYSYIKGELPCSEAAVLITVGTGEKEPEPPSYTVPRSNTVDNEECERVTGCHVRAADT